MYLEWIEIVGFCGICWLLLIFDEIIILIGENIWGKLFLLDVLLVVLLVDGILYLFIL